MYYVYQHIRLDTNAVFYVGKGSGERLKSKAHRNKHWHNVVNKAGYSQHIVFECEDEELAFFVEEEMIATLKDRGFKLTNQTNGGKGGISGYSHTEESRKKISQKLKGKLSGENHPRYGLKGADNPMYGRKQSAKARKGMSKNCCMKRPEVRAKISGARSQKAVAVECKGVVYLTLIDLANAENVSVQAIRSRIHRGSAAKYGYNILGKTKDLFAKDWMADQDLSPLNAAIAANS
jgi:hypothetical protein